MAGQLGQMQSQLMYDEFGRPILLLRVRLRPPPINAACCQLGGVRGVKAQR